MSLPLVFNHHALPYSSSAQAEADVPDFIKVAFKCYKSYGFQLILLDESLDKTWHNVELAPRYYWRDWLTLAKKNSEWRDARRVFLSLVTGPPLLALDTASGGDSVEVGLLGQVHGLNTLQAAYVYHTYLLSLPTKAPWNKAQITVWVDKLDESGVVSHTETVLNNLCDQSSLEDHAPELQRLNTVQRISGKVLWDQRISLFPSLVFLPELRGSLCNSSYSPAMLEKIRLTLIALSRFAEHWGTGYYKVYRHDFLADCGLSIEVSGESASTLQDPKKRAAREFWLPTGNKACFANHVKLSPNLRLHFYPEPEKRILYIGYLGPHLPV